MSHPRVPHDNPYSARFPPLTPPSGYHSGFFGQGRTEPPQLPPLSSLDFPWPQLPHHSTSQYGFPVGTIPNPGISSYSSYDALYTPTPSLDSGRSTDRHPSVARPQASSSTGSPEADPNDASGSAEEKRRRNTAASARFRIKKKQRTTNLERSVSDLAGRAEELEREAADLRKENGWLKEIVMLKGNRFSGVNLTGTLPQRADVDPLHDGKNHSWDRRPSRSKSDPGDSFPDDDEDDDGKNKKGKGKKKEDSGEA